MRNLTLGTLQAFMASETGEVFLHIVALSHPDMMTLFFVNDHVSIVSNGDTYEAFPFQITTPDDREDTISRISLQVDNVDRRMVQAVRSISTPATMTISVIRAAEPDVLVAGPCECTLRNVTANALTINGDLAPFENIMDEPYPQHSFTPQTTPALFA